MTLRPAQGDEVLAFKNVTKTFGGVTAVKECTFSVQRGAVVGIIGPNGAGKTTIFNLATGIYTADRGTIAFDGTVLAASARPDALVRRGIARTFQNIRLFPSETVLEHVLVAQNARLPLHRRLLPLRSDDELAARARALLEFTRLWDERNALATSLSYGGQRRVEIARALATEPKLLLLDEPVAGMNAHEAAEIRELVLRIRERGITVLLIEHDMPFVMGLCDRLHVLDFGALIAQGSPADVRRDPGVLRAYLGDEEPVRA
jgi:branched-chain amino acid transport system ATP-binding protein